MLSVSPEEDEFVVAIVGRWLVCRRGVWEFKLDKSRMGRCINLKGIHQLSDLQNLLKRLFSLGMNDVFAGCTYWAEDVLRRRNGMEVEPSVITSDANLRSFRSLCGGDKSINLCVTFRQLFGSELRLVLPIQFGVKHLSPLARPLARCSVIGSVLDPLAPATSAKCAVPSGSIDDETLIAHLEATDALIEDGEDEDVVEVEDVPDWVEEGIVADPGSDAEVEDYNYNALDSGGSGSDDDFVVPPKKAVSGPAGKRKGVPVGRNTPKMASLLQSFKQGISINDIYGYQDPDPIFDDNDFAKLKVNAIDFSKEDDAMFVGREFISRESFKIALSIYAINNVFRFKFVRFAKRFIVAECFDRRCDWRVYAHSIGESDEYEVRKANLVHVCDVNTRSRFTKHATARVVAALLRSKYANASAGPGPRARDVPGIILDENNVRISYWKAWKAKELAVESAQGTEESSYQLLPVYLHVLQLANPGTLYTLETEKDVLGDDRFKYVFLALGASISGMKHLRRVVVVDGTHLHGKYKGCLLAASGQDANFQIFPLAFSVVDSENDASWTWFMQKLSDFCPDADDLTFVSDRCQSIYKALGEVYPRARHGACLVHVRRNVKAKYRKGKVSSLVWEAGKMFRVRDFKIIYERIKSRSPECWKFLETIGVEHWTRSYFKGQRFNLMSSNIAESLNKALLPARGSPIVALLEFIRRMISRWLAARRICISRLQPGELPIGVEKQLLKHFKESVGFSVMSAGLWDYEVADKDIERYHVNLQFKTCSCLEFQKLNLPCKHAMAAAHDRGLDYRLLVGSEHQVPAWSQTVEGLVLPVKDPAEVKVPENVRILCLMRPMTKRPPGRPPKLRIPSIGEYEMAGDSQQPNRCGRCRGQGHNKATCTAPLK